MENAIDHWRLNKGIGSAIIHPSIDDRYMILAIIERLYRKTPNAVVHIITNTFKERMNVIEYITHTDNEETNKLFNDALNRKRLKVVSADFVNDKAALFNDGVLLSVLYHVEEFTREIEIVFNKGKFKLAIMNKLINDDDRNKLYKTCPLLNDFKQNEIDAIRNNTPVEEIVCPVTIDPTSEEAVTLERYNQYISDSIAIFGGINEMNVARVGDKINNISNKVICEKIAHNNGWNEQLDMSIEYSRAVDEMFNPISLLERANDTFNYIRNRSVLLSDYKGKLDIIADIINENPNGKILIINKRAEFATKVCQYLNNLYNTEICGAYHDKLEKIPATDSFGNPIFVKSGINKGERKMLAYKAQCTLNESKFNNDVIKILSTNNAPDKSLNIDVDVVIITSPLCEEIKNYIYRLSSVGFNSNPIKLYTLYIKNTLEEKRLADRELSSNHVIVNRNEINVQYDEKSDFIIVD